MAQYIDEEVDRVQSYLPESTKQPLIKILEERFIRDYQHVIDDEIKVLLDNNRHQGDYLFSRFMESMFLILNIFYYYRCVLDC
jgi:hypothetical protein